MISCLYKWNIELNTNIVKGLIIALVSNFKITIMKTVNYIGMVVGITAIALGWVWFGWELSLVIFLALAGNNMERNGRK